MIKTKIRKILVPLDGSKPSFSGLDEAIYIARQCGATITGLHVISIYPRNLGDLFNPLKARLLEDARKFMDKAEIISAQKGVVFHKKVVIGDAKSDINYFAKQNRFDLIVIGSSGFGPVKNMLLGNVSNTVVHKSKIPVLVVK